VELLIKILQNFVTYKNVRIKNVTVLPTVYALLQFSAVFWIHNVFMIWIQAADPYVWITDPDPALFLSGFEDANK
jgi:hypothetical protein